MLHRLRLLGALAFATPARAALLLATLLLAHTALRLWVLPQGLGYDDAEQVLSAQTWALAYRFEQPPLVTWLAKLLAIPLGGTVDLTVVTLLRAAMLGALYVFLYLAARNWLEDPVASVVAAASLSATYTLGWLAFADLPHSTLLAVMVAAALWLWARLIERPSLARTLAFGVACGLGLLAKWNFVVLAAGFLLAGLAHPRTRPLVLSWRTPLIMVTTGLIAAPAALAVLVDHPSFAELTRGVLAPSPTPEATAATAWADGLGAFALSALAFPQPWLALALLLLWPARTRARAGTGLLGLVVLVVLLLHALLVPLAGVTSFPERWMIVPLLPLPILVLALAAPAHRQVQVLGGALVVVAVAVLVLRAGIGLTDAAYCGKCRTRVPAEAFAGALRNAGFVGGTIAVTDMHLGGNLAHHLPEARLVALGFPERAWPEPGLGQCVVAWPEGARGERVLARAERALGVSLDDVQTQRVEAPILGASDRVQAMAFRLAPGAGRCR